VSEVEGSPKMVGRRTTTMAHHRAPHRIFGIAELTRLVAVQLVLIGEKSAVSFGCARRCLEGPVLSALWETQSSMLTLLKTLPEANSDCDRSLPVRYSVRGLYPPPEESNG